jgi:hypothetical protein
VLREDGTGNAAYVMGIVHGGALDMPTLMKCVNPSRQ